MGGIRIITIAALAIGMGALGAAPASAADDGASKPKKAEDTSRRVCRVVVPTGSRVNSRICRTQAEWNAAMDKSQESVLRHQTNEQSGMMADSSRAPM
jgi:hypothetical protein